LRKASQGFLFENKGKQRQSLIERSKQSKKMQHIENLSQDLNSFEANFQHAISGIDKMCSPENTLIVFDWDDTLFPTSALDRAGQLKIPVRVRPQLQTQLNSLAALCEKTLKYCEQFGRVMIITNSAPGWIDASCGQFMPTLLPKMKSLPTFAKPMSYHITFKLDVFKRECARYSNIISIGDGIAERTATLRLTGNPDKYCKSLKLKDLPTFSQMFDQLNLCMQRMEHVHNYRGDLDLRSQFGPFAGRQSTPQSRSQITFVHLTNFAPREESRPSSQSQNLNSISSTNISSTNVIDNYVAQPTQGPTEELRRNNSACNAGRSLAVSGQKANFQKNQRRVPVGKARVGGY